MRPIEKWIWLPKSDFPDRQETRYSEHVKTRRIDKIEGWNCKNQALFRKIRKNFF